MNQNTNQRIYSLDILRATLLFMGIFYHAFRNIYVNGEGFTHNQPWIDSILWLSHSFRMPTFFFLSGFFSQLIIERKSIENFLNLRGKRILLPFIIGIILFTFPNYFFSRLSQLLHSDTITSFSDLISYSVSLAYKFPAKARPDYLWFLYYLFLFSITHAVLLKLKMIFNKKKIHILISIFIILSLGFLFKTLMSGTMDIDNPNSYYLVWQTFGYYFCFYLFGSFIFSLYKLKFFTIKEIFALPIWIPIAILTSAFLYFSFGKTTLLASFSYYSFVISILGACLSFVTALPISGSPKILYFSDSAYFLYLYHEPVQNIIDCLLAPFTHNFFIRILFAITISIGSGFLIYEKLIRYTFVGTLLNGKRIKNSYKDTR
ncbi:MAG: acyltransferase family protein [Oligoflexia bacterium]|nr:acyltransferase family protein [Oligoflexia bacterium]